MDYKELLKGIVSDLSVNQEMDIRDFIEKSDRMTETEKAEAIGKIRAYRDTLDSIISLIGINIAT